MANTLTQVEKDQMVMTIWSETDKSLRELLQNVQPAPHSNVPIGTLVESLQQNILALRNAGCLNPKP